MPNLDALDDSILSGFPFGTIPPEVTRAIFAFVISLTGGFGATLSKLGISNSVSNFSPLTFLTSISTALFEPLSSAM